MSKILLPCPFCGAHLERSNEFSTRRQDHFVHPPTDDFDQACMLEHTHVVDYLDERADRGNVDRWNRRGPPPVEKMAAGKFSLGDRVRKTKGSSWQGRIVGFYSTELTPIGYAVESEREPGSVQIYPEPALAKLED